MQRRIYASTLIWKRGYHECVLWYVGSMSATNRVGFSHVLSAYFPSIRQFQRAKDAEGFAATALTHAQLLHRVSKLPTHIVTLVTQKTFLQHVNRWHSRLSPAYRDLPRQSDRPILTIAN